MHRFTYFHKQELIEFEGVVYEQVWHISGYESSYDDYDFGPMDRVTLSPTIKFSWVPPKAGTEGEIKTYGLQPAIDLGFLKPVAPVKN
jgi:hypothetical protein